MATGRNLQRIDYPDVPRASGRDILMGRKEPLRKETRGPAWIGLFIGALFFGVGGGWAATAELAGAVVAGGYVNPESSVHAVQHLEGGIIREIFVDVGDEVEAGQPLVQMEDVDVQSDEGELRNRLITLTGEEERLLAERAGDPTITFDDPLLADRDDPLVEAVISQQVNRFRTRQANDTTQRAVLEQRMKQLHTQMQGYDRQLRGIREQMGLLEEEHRAVQSLYNKGYERRPRLLALQRALASARGNAGEIAADIARAEQAIAETRFEIAAQATERLEQVDADLAETQAKKREIEERLRKITARLERSIVRAPITGVVLDMKFKSANGVVRPGESFMQIVPTQDTLVIDARIAPKDIDEVYANTDAYVTFPSYPQRTMARIRGRVVHVSADTFADEARDQRYYLAKVEVDRDHLEEAAPGIELTPGLPADVFIATTERTVMDYLIQPIRQSLEKAMRES